MLIENEGDHDDQNARACSVQTNAFSMHAVAARIAIHLSPRFEGNANKTKLKMILLNFCVEMVLEWISLVA